MGCKIGLVVMCGLPAAGKSTLARKLSEYVSTCVIARCKHGNHILSSVGKVRCKHICYDDIMPRHCYGDSSEQKERSWKLYRTHIKHCTELEIRSLLEEDGGEVRPSSRDNQQEEASSTSGPLVMDMSTAELQDCHIPDDLLSRYTNSQLSCQTVSEDGEDNIHVFIIDDNMFLRSMRYEYYQIAKRYGTGFCQVYIKCSVDEAQQLNKQRMCFQDQDKMSGSALVTSSTISKMAAKFEAPDTNNDWESMSVVLDRRDCCCEDQVHKVWQMILQSVYQPVEKIDMVDETVRLKDRLICSQNVLHQMDQILRREIGKQLKSVKDRQMMEKTDLRKLADQLNKTKSRLLEDVKSERLNIPGDLENYVMEASKDEDNPFYIFMRDLFEMNILEAQK